MSATHPTVASTQLAEAIKIASGQAPPQTPQPPHDPPRPQDTVTISQAAKIAAARRRKP